MGIKGIYKEIGTGKRISLTKLAVETLEETGRPLRLAIDISIWQFQVQAARGGSNPAIRTLFYRLLRLLGLSIQPIFVFDGPNKPSFKRNKRAGRGDGVATAMAKRLIRLFGFKVHDAPGEAEAECALLQQSGIVDAVLSEDVDTIMFGCTRTLRNWSSEGTRGSKSPTHVSLYDTEDLRKGTSGLDREGMVLVALMSGGDYLPEGIPGAGVKLACEAARAGFGKSLCRLKRSDTSELASWKEWLIFELRHNESGFFRTRHKALKVPDSFPNMDILRYYTHPVVSPASTLDKLRQQTWEKPLDIVGLREFVQETFDWSYRIGAIKFIRVLAPCLLVRKLMQRSTQCDHGSRDIEAIEKEESELVKTITSRRAHFSTDATSELRISFIPTNIVGYDFQDEPDEVIDYGRDGLALNSDDEMENLAEEEGVESVTKATSKKPFSPTEPDLAWIPETVAKLGIPLMVEDWEEAQRAKANGRPKARASRQKAKAGGTASGAMDKFVKVTKNTALATESNKASTPSVAKPASPARFRIPLADSPILAQSLPPPFPSSQEPQNTRATRSRSSKPSKSKPKSGKTDRRGSKPDSNTNPWTIAGSYVSPRVTKPTAVPTTKGSGPILISSSPPTSPITCHRRRHSPVNEAGDSFVEGNSSALLSSQTPSIPPQKRRSNTPCGTTPRESGNRPDRSQNMARDSSPTPNPAEKPHRKLARTESLPVEPTPRKIPTADNRPPRGLARAHTVVAGAGTPPSDSDAEEGDDDDDLDLPPLSTIIGRIPLAAPKTSPPPPEPKPKPAPTSTRRNQQQTPEKQTAPTTTEGPARMTKLYVARASLPGFFREVDVGVDEAEAEALRQRYARGPRGAKKGPAAVWRRSDVECIDLTGEE
ncbi:hypothetical protein F5X99DRAFT_403698 [Biscogniauxia marginata]|nr:hypothetical protein F5X99DRAFT_403698 [Biscogniauxia marginata]